MAWQSVVFAVESANFFWREQSSILTAETRQGTSPLANRNQGLDSVPLGAARTFKAN
jgi:hypothetical protein